MSAIEHEKQVSVLIPCYNGERLMHNALDSLLKQTYRNLQVVFVDDGSTDHTWEIALQYRKAFAEAKMELQCYQKENGGAASAINVGLKHYTGEYVMWMDSDDILYPDSIEKMVTFLEKNPRYDYCMGRHHFVLESAYDSIVREAGRIPPENETRETMFHDVLIGENIVFCPGAILCKRTLMERAIPSDGIYESRQGQNWQLLLPITYYGNRGYLQEPLIKIVAHKDSHSRMHRDVDALIVRQREFITLCNHTIQTIAIMPQEEKEKWCALTEIVHLQVIYEIQLRCLNLKDARITALQLQRLGCLELCYRFVTVGLLRRVCKGMYHKGKRLFGKEE